MIKRFFKHLPYSIFITALTLGGLWISIQTTTVLHNRLHETMPTCQSEEAK